MSVSDYQKKLESSVQQVQKRTQLEFMSLNNRVEKMLSEVSNVLYKSARQQKVPQFSAIKQAMSSKTIVTSQKRIVISKCVIIIILAIFFGFQSKQFSVLAWPLTVIFLELYSQYIIKTEVVGKRQRMPYESAIIGAAVGMASAAVTGNSIFAGVVYGIQVGSLSMVYRFLDYLYRGK